MTEAEWLSTTDQDRMVFLIRGELDRPAMRSDRKERLFAVACCYRMWDLMTGDQRECLALAERVADGLAPDLPPHTRAWGEAYGRIYRPDPTPRQHSVQNALVGALEEGRNAVISTMRWAESVYGRGVNSGLLRDIFGNPFRPSALDPRWRTEAVVALARGVYAERAFDRLPVLADALEDAGCADPDILGHCRGGGSHVRGCWVVDLVLGKG
jgi:hypothetical protein